MDFEAFYDSYWRQQGDTFDARRQGLLVRHVRPGDRVLQVDCGPGVLAARLAGLGAQVVGTDLSTEALRRARARGITAYQVNLDRDPLPFGDASFDAVVSDSQIEHRVDGERYLDECVRVLRPGGRLVLCVPNTAHWRVRWWLLRGRFPILANTPTDWLHLRFFTLPDLRRMLGERGVRIEHVDGSASLWVDDLYPRWLQRGQPARVYEALTHRRPSVFGRDLVLLGIKESSTGRPALTRSTA